MQHVKSGGPDSGRHASHTFGLCSALVSALALVGVLSTLILQQKQIWQQERDPLAEDKMRRETAALNAAAGVAQAYCTLYAGDPKGQEAQVLNAMLARAEGAKVDLQQTVGAKLRSSLKLLEDMQKKMQAEWEKTNALG